MRLHRDSPGSGATIIRRSIEVVVGALYETAVGLDPSVQVPEAQKTWSTVYLPEGVALKTTPPLPKMPPDEALRTPFRRSCHLFRGAEERPDFRH
jgi:hypothetical protein